ncbi:MAG TPA: putative LPS assembly protein LptD, partial [Rhodothermales bacterium]|nr:putative LPS assembly protein LptD [Rhodothermales bacterium]
MKIVDGKRVYTGPVQLYLFNIPLPIALPFGFLPATEGRRSGPLAPTYGEDELGFYLRNLGWYFPISDYLDLQVTGGLWSRGSWELSGRTRYARRYRYSGSLELSEGRSRYGEREDPGYFVTRARALRWQHAQTLGPNSNLNANVNLATSDYLQSRIEALRDRVTQQIQSTINYSTRWPRAGRSLTVAATHNQTISTGAVQLGLPAASFSQNERRPFARRDVSGGQPRWYETISYSYRATLDNRFNFSPLSQALLFQRGDTALAARIDSISWFDALRSPAEYRLATGVQSGSPFTLTARHDLPISATFDVRGLPFFPGFRANVVPNVTYTEQWVNQTERRVARDTTGVDVLRHTGFFALRQASATLSANTVFYGLFPVRVGPFDGVRHTVRPSLGVTFAPDYTAAPFDYFRSVTYTDPVTRQPRTDRYAVVPGVAEVRQAALQFSVDNVFETRRVRTDTTGVVTRTPLTLLNVGVFGSYNAAADSFRLSPLSLSARTNLFGRLDVIASASISPYRLRDSTTLAPAYDFSFDPVPFGRLASFTLAASTQFSGGRRGDPRLSQRAAFGGGPGFSGLVPGAVSGLPQQGFPGGGPFSPVLGAAPYADFSIPWSIAIDASFQYGRPFLQTSRSLVLNTRFDANLTPRWKLQGSSGFDVTAGQLSTTSLSVLRDFD